MNKKIILTIIILILLTACKGQIKAQSITEEEEQEIHKQTSTTKTTENTETTKETPTEQTQQEKETQKECKPGEITKNGECMCKEGYKYCEEQKRCIKETSCCRDINCAPFEYCVPTKYKTIICIQKNNQTACKSLTEDRPYEKIELQNKKYNIDSTEFFEGKIKVKINNENFELIPDEKITFDEITIWTEKIEELGGYCREETN